MADFTHENIRFAIAQEQVLKGGEYGTHIHVKYDQVANVIEALLSIEELKCRVVHVKVRQAMGFVSHKRIFIQLNAVEVINLELELVDVKVQIPQV